MKYRPSVPAHMLIVITLTAVACQQNDAMGGLNKQDFASVLELSGDGFRSGYLGLIVEGEALTGTVVMPSGTRAQLSGILSPDPENRWLTIEWPAAMDGCDGDARYHLKLTWECLSALTGIGQLTIQCNEDAPVVIEINATLLWDPRYAP